MQQPVGSPSNSPTLPMTVVFTDEFTKSIGVLLSDEDVEHVSKNAVSNALAGNVSPDFPGLYEFTIPPRNVRVLYQFHQFDPSKLYMVGVLPAQTARKPAIGGNKTAGASAVNAEINGLKKLKVGVAPRDFLKWLVSRFFRRHND